MADDVISGIIDNNKQLMVKLEERKDVYDQKIKEAKENRHSIWLKLSSFMHRCGTSNPMHLSLAQKTQYDEYIEALRGEKMSYNRALAGFLSTNGSLFDLNLDTGKLEGQQMFYEHIAGQQDNIA